MADVIKLVERRPPPTEPEWSARELLTEMIAQIDAGTLKPTSLMVFYLQDMENGQQKADTFSANVTRAEAIAYCALEMQRQIEDWRN